MKYVFLISLLVFSVWHLIESFRDRPKYRAYSKPFLVLSVLFYYIFASGEKRVTVLVLALIFSWLGDVLLIPKGMKWFIAGGISFMVSHILFIFVYYPQIVFSSVKLYIIIPAALLYYGFALFEIIKLRSHASKVMQIPLFTYLLFNCTMNLFALMQLMSVPCAGSVIAYIGAVLFFASDCSLFVVRFVEDNKIIYKKHFTVMLTYILAEFLITQGILMLTV